MQPIRVQSMTTPATTDVPATADQIERLVRAGCEIVRVTVPTRQDAETLPLLRAELGRRSLRVPLVADIHFSPGAAMRAVEHVEKVRINPGNFADRKRFELREYSDREYRRELERLRERVIPLVDRARELGVAMRIGTNQGSLSDRIVNRYGDSPAGMVESALEFVRICEDRGYRDIVLSMKSSNTQVMIRAYRLLAARLAEEGGDYPLHLGVTEAGGGDDGRIKSAVGIGSLLADGLGDTVRVSLTEDPVEEVPVCLRLVRPYNERLGAARPSGALPVEGPPEALELYSFRRRPSRVLRWGELAIGGEQPPRVELLPDLPADESELAPALRPLTIGESSAELLVIPVEGAEGVGLLARVSRVLKGDHGRVPAAGEARVPALAARFVGAPTTGLDGLDRVLETADRIDLAGLPVESSAERQLLERVAATGRGLLLEGALRRGDDPSAALAQLVATTTRAAARGLEPAVSLHVEDAAVRVAAYRSLAARLAAEGLEPPLILRDEVTEADEDRLLAPPARLGSLLADGLGDGIRLHGLPDSRAAVRLAYDILQASRRRISKAEYISCPSCGRTLFDLEQVTERVKALTGHLTDVKIAVMGCIVNGPGEMADADFGYVGWGPDRVALFVGKECVEKDIPARTAPDRLVELIRRSGRWRERPD
jgi:(E)-4-hydroxy-3-methylbut-2-enyl-diphosphate synthase